MHLRVVLIVAGVLVAASVSYLSYNMGHDDVPGEHSVVDWVEVPLDLLAGTYQIELALLDRAGRAPDTIPPSRRCISVSRGEATMAGMLCRS